MLKFLYILSQIKILEFISFEMKNLIFSSIIFICVFCFSSCSDNSVNTTKTNPNTTPPFVYEPRPDTQFVNPDSIFFKVSKFQTPHYKYVSILCSHDSALFETADRIFFTIIGDTSASFDYPWDIRTFHRWWFKARTVDSSGNESPYSSAQKFDVN